MLKKLFNRGKLSSTKIDLYNDGKININVKTFEDSNGLATAVLLMSIFKPEASKILAGLLTSNLPKDKEEHLKNNLLSTSKNTPIVKPWEVFRGL